MVSDQKMRHVIKGEKEKPKRASSSVGKGKGKKPFVSHGKLTVTFKTAKLASGHTHYYDPIIVEEENLKTDGQDQNLGGGVRGTYEKEEEDEEEEIEDEDGEEEETEEEEEEGDTRIDLHPHPEDLFEEVVNSPMKNTNM